MNYFPTVSSSFNSFLLYAHRQVGHSERGRQCARQADQFRSLPGAEHAEQAEQRGAQVGLGGAGGAEPAAAGGAEEAGGGADRGDEAEAGGEDEAHQ